MYQFTSARDIGLREIPFLFFMFFVYPHIREFPFYQSAVFDLAIAYT